MQTYVTNAATVLIFGIFCPLPLARRSAAESMARFDAQKWDESSLATAQKDPPQSKRSLERSAAASADAASAATGKAAAAAAARAMELEASSRMVSWYTSLNESSGDSLP